MLVAGADQVLVHIAVGRHTLREVEILLGVDDEVGRRADLLHHLLCTGKHLRVGGVGLHHARRYAEYLAQLAPTRQGELLDQYIRHGLVQQSEVALAWVQLHDPPAEIRLVAVFDELAGVDVRVKLAGLGRYVLPRQEIGLYSGGGICELNERMAVKLAFDDELDQRVEQAAVFE